MGAHRAVVRERNAAGLKHDYSLHPLGGITRGPPATEEEEGGVHPDSKVKEVGGGQWPEGESGYYCQTTRSLE